MAQDPASSPAAAPSPLPAAGPEPVAASPVTVRLTALLERIAADTLNRLGTGAAAEAKEEFLVATGRVHEGDPGFEMRMAQFTEWFLLDRPLGEGITPAERWIAERREHLDPRELTDALALAVSHRALLCWAGRTPTGSLLCDDPLAGIRWVVSAERPPFGLSPGDVFEGRIAGVHGEVHFTGAFCYHPPELAVSMRRALGRVAERGLPARQVMEQLLRWRLAYDRSDGIPAHRVYLLDQL